MLDRLEVRPFRSRSLWSTNVVERRFANNAIFDIVVYQRLLGSGFACQKTLMRYHLAPVVKEVVGVGSTLFLRQNHWKVFPLNLWEYVHQARVPGDDRLTSILARERSEEGPSLPRLVSREPMD